MMTRFRTRAALAVLAMASMATACSDTTTGSGATTDNAAADSSTSVSGITSSTASAVPGTEGASSTVASSSTSSTSTSTTTSTPAPAPLVLRGNGIGQFVLGSEVAVVVDGLSAQLGKIVTDETTAYPTADGLGQYQTTDGEFGFVAPVGRSVCWSVQLCAEFGGASGAAMSFTGWSYRADPTHALRSASGVTLDMRLSDAPAIRADEGGCYSVGSGNVDGIRLTLQSAGEPFGSFDESGNYVVNVPDPADITVTWMEAGEVPVFLYGDC